MTSHHALGQNQGLLMEVGTRVLRALHAGVHVVEGVLEAGEAGVDGVGGGLGGRAGGRAGGKLGGGERVAVDEGMARGAALDLAQADKIAALEIAVAVLELPQGRVGRAGVEDVAHCRAGVNGEGLEGGAVDAPLWKPYMFSWRTNEEMLVCLKYEASTREKSLEGDMTKLSLPADHEMRCWIERSSSML